MTNNAEHHDWVLEDLNKSGLTVHNFTIEPLRNENELKERLGFPVFGAIKIIDVGGYWISYPNAPGYYRLKLKKKIGDIKYFSPEGKGNHAYILPEVYKVAIAYNPDKPIFFTEGEKKAVKATSEGFPCIGLSGVWCFKDSDNEFLPELDNLILKYRKCYICFDSDITHKFNVRHAELRLTVELINRGAQVFAIRLPNEPNNDKNGLDDYLVRHGSDSFKALITKSQRPVMGQPFNLHITEGTPTELILKEASRIKSSIECENVAKMVTEHNKVSIKDVRKDLAKFGKNDKETNGSKQYSAMFEGLVDVVEKGGQSIFMVKEGDELKLKESIELNGATFYPPPIERLPFKYLPRADEVLEYYNNDSDSKLYNDLLEYHQNISELPSATYYDLLVAFDFLTYLTEAIQYSPYIWFYAIPERGKSRTGKGCIYVVYRGVHVESLREAYLFRIANNLGATIFFDVRDLSKKAEKAGSEDILLQRFEKGVKVARVIYPERGAHQDTVYYDIFGSTIIATNEPVNQILETRAVQISMPESTNRYEDEVTPEKALPFKERLVAFRARHLGEALPDTVKPASGRLGDILKPIIQVIKLVKPDREPEMLELINQIQIERKEEKSDSNEARILTALNNLEDEVEDGLLSIKLITEQYNESVKERYQASTKTIGWRLKSLGFKKRRRNNGMHIKWDERLILQLCERFGLNEIYQTTLDDEEKQHKLHQQHLSNKDRGSSGEDLSEVSTDNSKTTPKQHVQNPNKQRGSVDGEVSEVLSQGVGNKNEKTETLEQATVDEMKKLIKINPPPESLNSIHEDKTNLPGADVIESEKKGELMDQVFSEMDKEHPKDLYMWVDENDMELSVQITDTENNVNELFRDGSFVQFKTALEEYNKLHRIAAEKMTHKRL